MFWERWLKLFEKPIWTLAAAVGLTAALTHFEFSWLEASLYDLRMTQGGSTAPSPDIALIAIDDPSIRALGELAPLPLEHHARLLETLFDYQPRGVGYLVDFHRSQELDPAQFSGPWAESFLAHAQALDARGAFLLGSVYDVSGEVVPPMPLHLLPRSPAVIHKDGNSFSEDKVTRRALTTLYGKPAFHLALAQRLGLYPPGKSPPGSYYIPEVDSQFFFFRYHGDTSSPPVSLGDGPRRRGRLTTYPTFSFVDVLRRSVPLKDLQGKIILVSTVSPDQSSDFAYTPYSRRPFTHSKLAVHANILDAILRDEGITRAPQWTAWLTTFGASALVLGAVLGLTPLYGLVATVGLALLFLAVSRVLFTFQGLWLAEAQTLFAILLGYYFAVPYRLIAEYRKRWEFQRKNRILLQVEEMKTNFLSLVTHDLKTPVARIQGLAETLLRRAAPRLQEPDVENLRHIVSSTEDLNRFIGSILELTKVESSQLRPRLESRDVNQLVEAVIEGFSAQARIAGITIQARLEPLFPIRTDPSLLSKVLNNLFDNALKYSPQGSTVTVETRETEERVEIRVSDQGIGMSPAEIERLFTRFYRAKNDTTTRVSGTGLGLYLSKYFIEALGGTIGVESQEGAGSSFLIRLPLAPSSVSPGLTLSAAPSAHTNPRALKKA
jgi:hypothetical protein